MPKRPSKEAPEITIGNLERENKNLSARIRELVGFRDDWQRKYHTAMATVESLSGQSSLKDSFIQELNEQIAELGDSFSRLEGWRDCAREILAIRDLPGSSA